jgi:hypothetical protein
MGELDEPREQADDAAMLLPPDGEGVVEVPDQLPLARLAGCLSRRAPVAAATMVVSRRDANACPTRAASCARSGQPVALQTGRNRSINIEIDDGAVSDG